MTTVWFREDEQDYWRPASPMWTDINEERAHQIADDYNTKYSHGKWYVSEEKPNA